MKRTILYIAISIIILSQPTYAENHIDKLTTWFAGEYNTSEQAAADSQTIELHLEVTPFSVKEQTGKWFYLETSFLSTPSSPYRQEVYHFHPANINFINLDIYEISDKDKYVGALKNHSLLDELTIDKLTIKDGCSIYLKKIDDVFIGSSPGKNCVSTLRNAKYSQTSFEVTQVDFFLWERGYDLRGKQVWGQKETGYVFKKLLKIKK